MPKPISVLHLCHSIVSLLHLFPILICQYCDFNSPNTLSDEWNKGIRATFCYKSDCRQRAHGKSLSWFPYLKGEENRRAVTNVADYKMVKGKFCKDFQQIFLLAEIKDVRKLKIHTFEDVSCALGQYFIMFPPTRLKRGYKLSSHW